MATVQPILSVKELNISFGGSRQFIAVDDLSFHIGKGETLAVVGESGSGKSLTALALMGLLPKTAIVTGNMHLSLPGAHHDLEMLGPEQWHTLRGPAVAMVFQEPMSALNPVMKIGRQLYESIATHQKLSSSEIKQMAIEWLRKVQLPEPEKLYNRYPHQVSGGQKQRVMIAMAMCNHPALLIADEPTTALDVTVQKEIIMLMHELQKEHETAMIFITHDLALASEIADNILVMYRGKVMEYGNAQQVLNEPVHPYTKALVACKPAPAHKGHRLPVVEEILNAPDVPVKQLIAHEPPLPVQRSDEKILQVRDVKIWFAEHTNWLGKTTDYFKAVDGVSFDLYKGEVLGLVGESGCGKSTLSRSLMGLQPVKEGQMLFSGMDLANITAAQWKLLRRDIQMIFQDPYASLNPRMSVGDIIKEPLKVHGIVPRSEIRKEADRLMDLVQLPAAALKKYPHEFSGGQRQRIGIARALALRPKLLICDESVSALDVSIQAQILNLLKDLQKEFDLSYLFISHDLSVVHYISDRVMVMQAGRLVEVGTADKVLQQPEDAYTRKLIEAMPTLNK